MPIFQSLPDESGLFVTRYRGEVKPADIELAFRNIVAARDWRPGGCVLNVLERDASLGELDLETLSRDIGPVVDALREPLGAFSNAWVAPDFADSIFVIWEQLRADRLLGPFRRFDTEAAARAWLLRTA